MDAFLEGLGSENIVCVAYHMSWPGAGNDPFYLNNPTENTARRSFYNINAVPNLMCDGILGTSASAYSNYYNQRYNVPAPYQIELFTEVDNQIHISADVTCADWYWGVNQYLVFALIANEYNISGGGWTYTHFEWGMLDMAPNAYGINFDLGPLQTVTLETTFPIPSITTLNNLSIIAFIQDGYTKEVHQAKQAMLFPDISIAGYAVDDAESGNGNGIAEPGETCGMWVNLANSFTGGSASGITAELSTTDPGITITNSSASFPDLAANGNSSNQDELFEFQVAPDFVPHAVTFWLAIDANNGLYSDNLNFTFTVGVTPLLVVDDDGGVNYEANFLDDLDDLAAEYNYWDISNQEAPAGEYLVNFEHVIWLTGREDEPVVEAEQEALIYYLDRGGKLFITSENLGDDHGTTSFYTDYMHAQHEYNQVSNTILNGEAGDPISDGTTLSIVGAAYWPDSQSTMIPDTTAYPVYKYSNTAQSVGALRFEDEYALLYFAFPYECINPNQIGYTPRLEVMENILDWFDSLSLPAHFFIFDREVETGSAVTIPVFTSAVEYENLILSYDFDLSWDPMVLEIGVEPISIEGTITPEDWQVDYDSSTPGVLSISASSVSTDLSGIGTLIKVNFQVIGQIGDETELSISNAVFNEPLEIITHSGNITITGVGISDAPDNIQPVDFQITSIYPNPFNPETTIEFSLPESGWLDAEVYNIKGERVTILHSGFLNAGSHAFRFDGANLASGIYIIRLESDNMGSIAQKLVLMK